jgi:hypothetical protein
MAAVVGLDIQLQVTLRFPRYVYTDDIAALIGMATILVTTFVPISRMSYL